MLVPLNRVIPMYSKYTIIPIIGTWDPQEGAVPQILKPPTAIGVKGLSRV